MSSKKRKRLESLVYDNDTETKKTKKVTFLNNHIPVSQEFPLLDSLGREHFQTDDEHIQARKERSEEASDKSEQWIRYNDNIDAYLNTYRNKGGVIDDVILKDLIRYYEIRGRKDNIENGHSEITFCGAAKCFAVIASTAALTYLLGRQFGGKRRLSKRRLSKRRLSKRRLSKRRQTKRRKYK